MLYAKSDVFEKNGRLKVEGRYMLNEKGEKARLKGISMGWHNWWGRFYNASTVDALANDWNAEVIRIAIGVEPNKGFLQNPQYAYACVDTMVTACKEQGIYALVDWHSHGNTLEAAKEFFANVSSKYGDDPQVLYEIWNEPVEHPWGEIKAYAEEIIPIIRKNAPNAIIIVGSPRWDQDVDKAADKPVKSEGNIMYAVHFYADTHKKDIQKKMMYAINKNLPVFLSECASLNNFGDGNINVDSWNTWMQRAKDNNLSVILWDIADKDETCSMLLPTASDKGREWKEEEIKPWGKMAREYLKSDQ